MQKFKNIDVKVGLSYMSEDKSLYLNILKDFRTKYSNFKFEHFDDNELKIEIHTLKGLSASIGANSLYLIMSELENSHDISYITRAHEALDKVLTDLSTLDTHKPKKEKLDTSPAQVEELFIKLKDAVKSKRPNNYKPILEALNRYKMDDKITEYFADIQSLLLKFKFKDAIILIDFINHHISLHRIS